MRQSSNAYLFPGAFAPILSLDEVVAAVDEETGAGSYDLTDPEAGPQAQVEFEEAKAAVNSFLAKLSTRDQIIMQRLFWDERSQTQIAAELNISKMAISKAVARIYRRGRVTLAQYEGLAS